MLKKLNLRNGKITFDDITGNIDENLSIESQVDNLKEDLLQIEIGKEFIVDVGFHPDFDPNGEFKIQLIKNYDWENPLFHKSCKELKLLPAIIQEAIDKTR